MYGLEAGTLSYAVPATVSGALTLTPTVRRTGTATFSVAPALPDGLSLDAATGVISGTLTRTGTSTHTVTMRDISGIATASVTVNNPAPVTAPAPVVAPRERTATRPKVLARVVSRVSMVDGRARFAVRFLVSGRVTVFLQTPSKKRIPVASGTRILRTKVRARGVVTRACCAAGRAPRW